MWIIIFESLLLSIIDSSSLRRDLYDRTCYQAALRRTGNSVREKERPPLRNLSQFGGVSRELCESSGNSKICRSLFLALCDSKISSCHDCIILKVSSVRYNLGTCSFHVDLFGFNSFIVTYLVSAAFVPAPTMPDEGRRQQALEFRHPSGQDPPRSQLAE